MNQLESYHLPTTLLKLDEGFRAPPQSLKPEQGYDTLTTTTITKVESTPDKLKEVHVVNTEAKRDNLLRNTLAALLTTFSIILDCVDLLKFRVCVMMLDFMILSDSFLCNDCWCIVGLLPTMTQLPRWVLLLYLFLLVILCLST